MKKETMICPFCGATIDPKDEIDTFSCEYCGGVITLSELSDAAYKAKVDIKKAEYQTKVTTDKMKHESEIKSKELEQAIKLKSQQLEHEKYIIKNNNKLFFIPLLLAASIILGGIWLFVGRPYFDSKNKTKQLEIIESQINEDMEAGNYDSALLKAQQLYYDSNWSDEEKSVWESKRENYISLINQKKHDEELEIKEKQINEDIENGDYDSALLKVNQLYDAADWSEAKRDSFINLILERKREDDRGVFLPAPESAEDLKGEKYTKVEEKFKSAGFTNISTQKSSEEKGFFDWNNTVEHITISGKSDFKKNELYEKNSTIVIYYYSKD